MRAVELAAADSAARQSTCLLRFARMPLESPAEMTRSTDRCTPWLWNGVRVGGLRQGLRALR